MSLKINRSSRTIIIYSYPSGIENTLNIHYWNFSGRIDTYFNLLSVNFKDKSNSGQVSFLFFGYDDNSGNTLREMQHVKGNTATLFNTNGPARPVRHHPVTEDQP